MADQEQDARKPYGTYLQPETIARLRLASAALGRPQSHLIEDALEAELPSRADLAALVQAGGQR
ncbi:MAG TPA: ribbon-helix-helix domain-containing protein [Streptosporangiaceae bacterium]|nr:ribbon-helix-helix domain-containing protein [Streptosporangiaceae bacterium]